MRFRGDLGLVSKVTQGICCGGLLESGTWIKRERQLTNGRSGYKNGGISVRGAIG
jgi:hypothetical protein